MKKLSVIVAMALAVVANYSCGEYDNAANENGATTIKDENGNPYEVGSVLTLQAIPGEEVQVGLMVYPSETSTVDYYAVKSGENIVTAKVSNSQFVYMAPIVAAEDGVVELLGNNDLMAFAVKGATPTSFDSKKLAKVKQIDIDFANVTEVALPKLENLERIGIYDCGLTAIDLGDNNQLKEVSLQRNDLKTLDLKKYYKLKKVDVSNNPNLTEIALSNEYADMVSFAATNCSLTEFDGNKMRNLQALNLSYNKLTSFAVNTKKIITLDVSNNNLSFSALPLPSSIESMSYNYAPQNEIAVENPLTSGILDLSAEYKFKETVTNYIFNIDEKVDDLEGGKFAFLNPVKGVVCTMTNDEFPGLTLNTIAFDTNAAPNEKFTCTTSDEGLVIEGGIVKHVFSKTGTAEDKVDYLNYKKYKNETTDAYYNTIRVNGTKQSIAKKPFNYIRVDLDEPLKKGNVIRFTGFRLTPTSEHAQLYLLFDLLNDDQSRFGLDYFPGSEKTVEYTSPYMFANIWESNLVPDYDTLLVDEFMEGSKSFKIALDPADTEAYITKIEILRQAK